MYTYGHRELGNLRTTIPSESETEFYCKVSFHKQGLCLAVFGADNEHSNDKVENINVPIKEIHK